MTTQEFRGWLKKRRFTQKDAALALGLSERQIRRYVSGETGVPKVVWLATQTVDEWA